MMEWWAIGLVVIGAACILRGIREVLRGFVRKRWPQAKGVILKSEILDFEHRNPETDDRYGVLIPKVLYEYEVLGVKYQSSQTLYLQEDFFRLPHQSTIERWKLKKDKAERNLWLRKIRKRDKMQQYLPNKELWSYYDPKNPKRSVIDPRTDGKEVLWSFVIWPVYISLGYMLLLGIGLAIGMYISDHCP